MLKIIIGVIIGDIIFLGLWILFAGFTTLKAKQVFLDDNPKGASARESSKWQSCNDPDCICEDCD